MEEQKFPQGVNSMEDELKLRIAKLLESEVDVETLDLIIRLLVSECDE